MNKHKSHLSLLFLGLFFLLTSSIVACSQPTPTLAPPAQPPPATESQPESPTQEQPQRTLVEAKVIRVIDGDTIQVSIGGNLYNVRYIGIDTPETVHPQQPVEYFGKEASEKNRELVEGKIVSLEKDVSETDKYGRLLRYVYVGDLFVNAELVRLGYAQVVTYPPDVKYQDLFLKLQAEARNSSRGLWATPSPPPAVEKPSPSVQGQYAGSKKSDVYHYPSCRYVKQIYPENLIWFSSASDARAHGYRPCKVCNPP